MMKGWSEVRRIYWEKGNVRIEKISRKDAKDGRRYVLCVMKPLGPFQYNTYFSKREAIKHAELLLAGKRP